MLANNSKMSDDEARRVLEVDPSRPSDLEAVFSSSKRRELVFTVYTNYYAARRQWAKAEFSPLDPDAHQMPPGWDRPFRKNTNHDYSDTDLPSKFRSIHSALASVDAEMWDDFKASLADRVEVDTLNLTLDDIPELDVGETAEVKGWTIERTGVGGGRCGKWSAKLTTDAREHLGTTIHVFLHNDGKWSRTRQEGRDEYHCPYENRSGVWMGNSPAQARQDTYDSLPELLMKTLAQT